MTIPVPRSLMDPVRARGATSRALACAPRRTASSRCARAPRRAPTRARTVRPRGAPGIFNLAFRFDEPQAKQPPPGTGPNVGIGNWFESKQAAVLKRPTPLGSPSTRDFGADVSFARLAAGDNRPIHPPRRDQARIFSSRSSVPEGSRDRFPRYGGRLQPYMVRVPPARPGQRPGLTWALHSLSGTYAQYAVIDPNQLAEFGDQRGILVVTPLGRGPDGWYMNVHERGRGRLLRGVARRRPPLPARLRARRAHRLLDGRLGDLPPRRPLPRLFGRAFTAVGPPARAIWTPPSRPHGDPPDYTASPRT
jgi:hypothetical protein